MTATVSQFPSRNPHIDCHLFPCPRCKAKREQEQAARDRHPAGSDYRDVMPASNWMLCVKDNVLHADMVDLDSELIEDLAQACAEFQHLQEQGRPDSDADLGIAADKIRDLLTVTLNRDQALAIAMALQNHASRMEVRDV